MYGPLPSYGWVVLQVSLSLFLKLIKFHLCYHLTVFWELDFLGAFHERHALLHLPLLAPHQAALSGTFALLYFRLLFIFEFIYNIYFMIVP